MEINVTVLLLFVHPLMTSVVIHTRRPNSIKRQLRTCFLWFCWCCFFAFWGAEKHFFHICTFRPTIYAYHRFSGTWRSVIVYRTEIK